MSENGRTEQFTVDGSKLLAEIKALVKESTVTRIVVKNKEGKALMDIPVVAGVVGVALLPFWAGVAALVGVANEFTLTVERVDPKPVA